MGEATQVISAGHGGDLAIGWYIIVGLWVVLVVTMVALFVDTLLPYRKRKVAQHAEIIEQSREPLWLYTAVSGVVLAVWIASVIPVSESYVYTMSIAAAFAAIAGVVLIFTYLLRMVFPRVPQDKVANYLAVHGMAAESRMSDRHDVTVIDAVAPGVDLDSANEDDPFDMELFSDDNPKGA